jgi:hypothetical protein
MNLRKLKAYLIGAVLYSQLVVTGPTSAAATTPTAQDLAQRYGDGGVSAFYDWQQPIPKTPGQLLAIEPIAESQVKLAQASANYRILYSSTSGIDSRRPIVVSGSLHLPKGQAPAGGWPVVLWAHGTVGLADICAPSSAGRSYRDHQYLNRWLSEGFAVVATDYEGLGVAGPHWLINNPMLAFSVLDSARAALQAKLGLANTLLIVGQSQGAAAAIAASAYSATYAPELKIKASIATGVIYRDRQATTTGQLTLNPNLVSPALAYSIYGFLVLQSLHPQLGAEQVFSEAALPLVEQARHSCLTAFMADVQQAGLSPAQAFKPNPPAEYLQQQAQFSQQYGYYPTLKINHPVFIGTGANDTTPDARSQIKLVNDLCQAGTLTQGHVYYGLGHSETVNASLKDSIPFAKKALHEQPIASNCQPQIQ